MCDRWRKSFLAFYKDMGPRPSKSHSIERNNNDGHYEPSNCRWATPIEQANNRRSNVFVDIPDGSKKTISQLAKETGLNRRTLEERFKKGWPYHELISAPRW